MKQAAARLRMRMKARQLAAAARRAAYFSCLTLACLLVHPVIAAETGMSSDPRTRVPMPEMLRAHMLSNMREHLLTLGEIQQALARGDFDHAADLAEQNIGLSSTVAHHADQLAPYMPPQMRQIGMTMHKKASEFALIAQEASADGNLSRALNALGDVTVQCAACHAAYRVH